MPEWTGLGKTLVVGGAILVLLGLVFLMSGRLFGSGNEGGLGWLGRLPGDIYIKRENFTFYAPLTSGLLISLLLSLLLYVVSSFWKR